MKQPACGMHPEMGVVEKADASTADERWPAWVAKGVERDTRAKRRTVAVTVVIASGLGLWLAIVLLPG